MGALDGKIAVVTGGTSGIGEGIAKAFVLEGAKVVITGRREEEGRALEKQIGVRFVRADVAIEADVKAMVDKTVEWFGRLDCLVNNAGIPSPMTSITEIDVATIDQILAVNVRGVVLGIKHAAPVMIAQRSGSVINIGSVAGIRGGISAHIYSASKGAVQALTRSAAAELGEKGIRVNCISPGAIVTGIFGKNAGLEGSKADRVTGVVKERFASDPADPASGASGRYRPSGGFSRQRRVRVCQRPGHCGRRRDDERHPRLVGDRGRARGNGEAHQGGGRGIVTSPPPELRRPCAAHRSEVNCGTGILSAPLRLGALSAT